MKRGLSRPFFEGLSLCLGVGLMYLAADVSDKGETWWAIGLASASLITFCVYFVLVGRRADEMRQM